MILAELLGRAVTALALLPAPRSTELMILAAVLLATALVPRATALRPLGTAADARTASEFPVVRVLLRSSDPAAEGHPRARAPGGTS